MALSSFAAAKARIWPSSALPAMPWAARDADHGYGVSANPDWRAVDWPRHTHQVEIDGRTVNYVDLGEGGEPAAVFIHGLGGNWQSWLENLPRTARERRAVAVDLPGFGESEMPEGEISISRYARVVNELCDRLGLGPVAAIGNSMGGFIAAELAISHPSRVERLVLAASAGISTTSLHRRPLLAVAGISAALASRGAARRHDVVARHRLRHAALAIVIRHPSRLRQDLLYEIMRGAGRPGFIPALEALAGYDFRDSLPDISCPTLVLWGSQDMLVPVEDAREFDRLIADSRQVVMHDTGHVPMLERPEAFNDCLAKFLAGFEPEPVVGEQTGATATGAPENGRVPHEDASIARA